MHYLTSSIRHWGWLIAIVANPSFGQNFYFQEPELLPDTINSRAEESYPIYSATDSTLFFVRTLFSANIGGARSGQDIWFSQRQVNGSWSLPKNDLEQLNNRGNNAIVGISETGNTLYLLNAYEKGNTQAPGMSFSFRQAAGWPAPNDITIPTLADNLANHYGIYVAPSEDVAIVSMQQEEASQEDLYVIFKNSAGEWSTPLHLGDTVNTEGYEMSPFLSDDQQYLFFASNGHPGYGNADIFVSARIDSSWTRWSKPENLGDAINSTGFDAYLTVTPDQEVFFVSNRYGRSTDIYRSQLITQEERDRQLANRIDATRRQPLDSLRNGAPLDVDAETQALLAETQALLNEFNGTDNASPPAAEEGATAPDENPEADTATAVEEEAELLLFGLNSSKLQPTSIPYLESLAEQLKGNPTFNVELVGHADDTGGKDYNLKLSINRAQMAKQFLMEKGIEEARIVSYGRGSTEPVKSGTDPETRRQNRRVEVKLDR